jgi:4-oxalmesaconate hydratase
MIIDCHGHYTTAPEQLQRFRNAQLAAIEGRGAAPSGGPQPIGDEEIRESIERNQLRLMRERGGDLTIFSPKASGMAHHVPDPAVADAWARASNDLVHRVVELFPDRFAGVGQLPQTPDGELEASIREARRCVNELGFVGFNVNPDPSGGYWTGPPMTDERWYPLYETLVEHDVPAMIHVSGSCNPNFHALGAHYLNADTSVFMQLLEGDLFAEFPTLRLVIPHGGGAVPYHWGRYQGLAVRLEKPPLEDHLMNNVFFDTCVYHEPGIELLLKVIGTGNVLFASEMLGAVRGSNPATGSGWDDTKRYVDAIGLTAEQQIAVFEGNVQRVYPRLAARIASERS